MSKIIRKMASNEHTRGHSADETKSLRNGTGTVEAVKRSTESAVELLDDEEEGPTAEELAEKPELAADEVHIDDPIRIYLMQMGELPMLR